MTAFARWLAPPVLVVLYAFTLVLLGIWLGRTESFELKTQLAALTPWSLELSFLLLVGGGWAARRAVSRSLPASRLTPVLLALAGFIAVTFLPPRTHRIFYDEDIYQNVAQNILWRHQAEMCNEGVVEHGAFECFATEYNKEPSAFPFLLSLLFRLTGVKESSAHLLNNLLFAFGVVCAYWLGNLIFGNRKAAVAAGVLYLLTPENLLWGATVAVEPGAAAFAGCAAGAWILFIRERTLAAALFAAGAIAYAAQWRPESLLIIPLAAVATLVFSPDRFRRRELYAVALVILILLLPHLAHLWAVRGESWGSGEAGKFSWAYVVGNLESNSIFYVEGKEHPLYFTLLAVLGLVFGATRWKQKLIPLVWLLLFFGIFVPFHAGSYRYGADVRFSLLCAMPLALLGGAGAAWMSEWMGQRTQGSRWAAAAPLVAMGYFFTAFLPLVGSVGSEAWAARADHDIAGEFLELVPEGSVVLTHNPGMIQVMGMSAVQASMATYQPAKVDEWFRRFPGGVYFHFNFWCNVPDPVQNAFCTKILETYPTEVVEERSAGNYRYVLHRLMPRRGALP